jgi:hypothetical protein
LTTKYGPTVLMSIKESEYSVVKVFIPKRNGSVITDDDINDINTEKVSLNQILYFGC